MSRLSIVVFGVISAFSQTLWVLWEHSNADSLSLKPLACAARPTDTIADFMKFGYDEELNKTADAKKE